MIPTLNNNVLFRLPNSMTIYDIEGQALYKSLELIHSFESNQSYVVYTDSLSVLNNLLAYKNDSIYDIVHHIRGMYNKLIQKNIDVVLCWIPSHVGIEGNEMADMLAKEAASKMEFTEDVTFSNVDMYRFIDWYILRKWQIQYNEKMAGKHYYEIEPTVNRTLKYTDKPRRKEIVITRLRLNCALVNQTKFNMKIVDTPDCIHCHKPETVRHLLFDCQYEHILPNTVSLRRGLMDLKITLKLFLNI